MAARGDAVLVVIEPIHEWFDGDGKNVRGTNELAAGPEADAIDQVVLFRADDGAQFIGIEQRAVRNLIHRAIEINVPCDIGGQTEALNKKRDPPAIGMAARNG